MHHLTGLLAFLQWEEVGTSLRGPSGFHHQRDRPTSWSCRVAIPLSHRA